MFTPNSIPYQQQPGFQRTYRQGRLTLGLFFPSKPLPVIRRACSTGETGPTCRQAGFSALWFRDVPLRDPSFGDSGQVFDPGSTWVSWPHTHARLRWVPPRSSCQSAIPCIPPRLQPVSISSAVAACYSVWLLVTGRWSFRIRCRPGATRQPVPRIPRSISRGSAQQFRAFDRSGGALEGADLIPPTTAEIPFFVTGHSRQTLEWIARYSHGWISYPRAPKTQQLIVESWRTAVRAECGELFKPFTQSLYIDLADNPQTPPRPIHLGYQLGRYHRLVAEKFAGDRG